jgi:antitoxin component HigA of HigAB toxin-antitoxin module
MDNKETFPTLRALMAMYGKDYKDMAEVINNTYQTFSSKLHRKTSFTFEDLWTIKNYFSNLGESKTIDELFFNWQFTIVK